MIADGIVVAGEPYFRRCCDLAEQTPNLYSPHFAIANLDPANLHGLFTSTKVHNVVCSVNRLYIRRTGILHYSLW